MVEADVPGEPGPTFEGQFLLVWFTSRCTAPARSLTTSLDGRQNVNSITLDATDGRDRLRVNWDRR